ncbi:MAG: hypothetical protein U1B80_01700 [Anaerolineaceae bacterium]|nr:hypothetical protein [Anaerolineaceae bacterium]
MIARRVYFILSIVVVGFFFLGRSSLPPADQLEQVRAYTRWNEFDYLTWALDALLLKSREAALGLPAYLSVEQQRQVVFNYLRLVDNINHTRAEVELIYADPKIQDPEQAAASRVSALKEMQSYQELLAPLCESVLQQQVSATLADLGLSLGGQPIPPVLYHITAMPQALITSPRDSIRQSANISLLAGIRLEEIIALEQQVEGGLKVSALVVPVGGVGIYPPMVMSTTHLPDLLDIIAHEWTHNFLTLRPLGVNYDTSPALRTMNETTASIVGRELSQAVLMRYYPELAPPRSDSTPETSELPTVEPAEPPPFDFRVEMHKTRVTTDQLLAEGKIDEAEAYMELRRRFLWENGYPIRRINQAYFAFYGAYADQPGGAAGEDPVGPTVRRLREQSRSLTEFINRISWMTSFEELERSLR